MNDNIKNTQDGIDCHDRLVNHSIQLAMIGHELKKWNDEVNTINGFDHFNDPITADNKIMNAILDLWEIPAENYPDDPQDDWEENVHYCRDTWDNVWDKTVTDHGDYRKFVDVVASIYEMPNRFCYSKELEPFCNFAEE